jgi:hypothetical protein
MSNYDHEKLGTNSEWTEEESVGAQIEAEKGHDIQYRTCSWQKVRPASNDIPHPSRELNRPTFDRQPRSCSASIFALL